MNVVRCALFAPKDVNSLDAEIMRHIVAETNKLFEDGMCDLYDYGNGDEYDVTVAICFERKGDK